MLVNAVEIFHKQNSGFIFKKKDKQHSGKVGVEWKGIIMGECTCYPWKEENKYKQ